MLRTPQVAQLSSFTCSTPPNSSRALLATSSGDIPAWTYFSDCYSTSARRYNGTVLKAPLYTILNGYDAFETTGRNTSLTVRKSGPINRGMTRRPEAAFFHDLIPPFQIGMQMPETTEIKNPATSSPVNRIRRATAIPGPITALAIPTANPTRWKQ